MDDPRQVLEVGGADRIGFLQGLITNHIDQQQDGLVYAALLSPQGKYLADFLLRVEPERVLIDVAQDLAPALVQRLMMYKLRAAVTIAESGLFVHRGLGEAPADGLSDPRDPALGWRAYRSTPAPASDTDWDALRVERLIPQSGIELIPNETYILEAGFERLHGVDFRKGCYVGQEVTARMKHKTELRKGLARVDVAGDAAPGTPITAEGRAAGTLHTRSGDRAIAYLRFDRAGGRLCADAAEVTLSEPLG